MFANALDILMLVIGALLALLGGYGAKSAGSAGGAIFGAGLFICGVIIVISALKSLVG
jgi:hypothetical protein